MAVAPQLSRPEGPDRLERELLARLGLGGTPTDQEIEIAHDRVVEYLEQAPRALQAWARREIAAADEAFALLSDPVPDAVAGRGAPARATRDVPERTGAAAGPGRGARTRPPAAPGRARAQAAVPDADDNEIAELEELEGDDELEARPTRRDRAASRRRGRRDQIAPLGDERGGRIAGRRLVRLGLIGAGAVAVVAIAVGVYAMGASPVPGFSGSPAPEASPTPALDQAQVAALMQKITANPKDIASLQGLCDLFFQAGDYATASYWAKKVLAIDPKNLTALLAVGAAAFNLGDSATAEQEWRAVLAIDDRNLEAHYDLGFMYLSKDPPDVANVRAEWDRVIAIDPNSDVAKTVATHLQSLGGSPAPGVSAAPGASAGPGASAAPVLSQVASPAASPSGPAVSPAPSTPSGTSGR